MSFKELFPDLISGQPIKRKSWRGYWIYKHGRIEIHAKNGDIIDFQETEDLLFTLSNIIQNDWEIATSENCDIKVP